MIKGANSLNPLFILIQSNVGNGVDGPTSLSPAMKETPASTQVNLRKRGGAGEDKFSLSPTCQSPHFISSITQITETTRTLTLIENQKDFIGNPIEDNLA